MTRLRAVTHFGVQARRSIVEYAQALRSRYFRASREDKGKMLDESTQVYRLAPQGGHQVTESRKLT